MMRAIFDPAVWASGYIGGYGSGKSRTAGVIAIAGSALNPGCPFVVVSPTFGMLSDTMFMTLEELLDDNEIPYRRMGGGRPKIVLPWGEIWGRSAEKPEKLKGPNIAGFVIDEGGIVKRAVWVEMCARTRHPKAKRLIRALTTTPEGFNWCYDFFGTDKPGYVMVNAQTTDNKSLPADYVDQLREVMDDQHAAAYIEGKFCSLYQRQVYYNFDRQTHAREVIGYNQDLPLFWSNDWNVDPMCSVVFQMPRRDRINVIDEIILPHSNTPEAAREFVDRFGNHEGIVNLCGDPAGRHRDTRQDSARSDFDILEDAIDKGMPRASIERYITSAAPATRRRYNIVNALLKNAKGASAIAVSAKCQGVITSFERTVRKEGSQQVDKATEWNWGRYNFQGVEHLTDAFGYPLTMMFRDPRDIRRAA